MAIYVAVKDGMTNHGEGQHLVWARDLLVGAGIVDIATGFKVTQNASPDMNVLIAAGVAYVPNDSFTAYSGEPKFWPVLCDAAETLAIASNPSGSTRLDLVAIKCDDGIAADANASNIATIVRVAGTPGAGAPTLPANHLLLATITVASGATSIVNANIADGRIATGVSLVKLANDSYIQALTAAGVFADLLKLNASGQAEIGPDLKLGGSVIGWDGWQKANEVWTYASASTFTVPGDQTAKYTCGTRLKFVQTTTKYAVVLSSSYGAPNTTVTIMVNTDYTIANAAITLPYISYMDPPDFPSYFNFNSNPQGFTGEFVYNIANISISQKGVVLIYVRVQGSSNATTLSMTAPVTIADIDSRSFGNMCTVCDGGTWQASPGKLAIAANSNTINAYTTAHTAGWTNSGTKSIFGTLLIQI